MIQRYTAALVTTFVLLATTAGIAAAGPAVALVIKATEGAQGQVEVQVPPDAITIVKLVPWKQAKKGSSDGAPYLEFLGPQPRSLEVDLDLDESASSGDVYATYISTLEEFAESDDDLKRPPMVTFTWGNNLPVFKGVVESLVVRYTLFLPDGTPTRATVNLRMREAGKLTTGGPTRRAAASTCILDADCPLGEICRNEECESPMSNPRR